MSIQKYNQLLHLYAKTFTGMTLKEFNQTIKEINNDRK